MIHIAHDDPSRPDVHLLLSEHLADMFATSPAESVHALDHAALSGPLITFWTAREDGELLGCGALKLLDSPPGTAKHGEIKSMRTTASARGRGVATFLLTHILDEARGRNYGRVFLETGAEEYFAPARRLLLMLSRLAWKISSAVVFWPCSRAILVRLSPLTTSWSLTPSSAVRPGPSALWSGINEHFDGNDVHF